MIVFIKFGCMEKNQFFLQFSLFIKERQALVNKIRDIHSLLIDQNGNSLCYTLLFGKENMDEIKNAHFFEATMKYISSIESFSNDYSNDSLVIELNISFLVSFYTFQCFLDILKNFVFRHIPLYTTIYFVCRTFFAFYFYFVCNCPNYTCVNI